MQQGFIRYIQEGEQNFAQPAWLMGGVIDSRLLLFYHFFRIAFYSIGLYVGQARWTERPAAVVRSMMMFVSAVAIIWRPIMDELML